MGVSLDIQYPTIAQGPMLAAGARPLGCVLVLTLEDRDSGIERLYKRGSGVIFWTT
jgi:hypothetical protein